MCEKVSIIIPVYESEDTIERCVWSLVNGTYKNIEIILAEDCSKDASWKKCKELAANYSQIQCVHNDDNKGVSYTRNRGLELANGKYLMFADSDDWVEADFVEEMVAAYERFQEGVPICGYVNHDEVKNQRTDIFVWGEEDEVYKRDVKDAIVELYEKRLLQMIWNKLFLTEEVKKHNIVFEEGLNVGEDFRFLLKYLEVAGQKEFIFLDKPLYHYSRDNENSLATSFTNINIKEPMQNLRKMYELAGKTECEIDNMMKSVYEKQLNQYAYAIMHNSKLSSAEKKQRVIELSKETGKTLYRKHKVLCVKEAIRKGKG